jgi:hypothetical protein
MPKAQDRGDGGKADCDQNRNNRQRTARHHEQGSRADQNQSESEIFRFDDPGGMERRQHEQHDPQHDRERGEQRVAPTCLEARKARLDAWVNHQHLPPLPPQRSVSVAGATLTRGLWLM